MASSGVVSMLKSQFKIGSELPIAFSAPPPALIEKKDEDDESEVVVPPDSITLDISGSPLTDVSGTVIVGQTDEPKIIVHM